MEIAVAKFRGAAALLEEIDSKEASKEVLKDKLKEVRESRFKTVFRSSPFQFIWARTLCSQSSKWSLQALALLV